MIGMKMKRRTNMFSSHSAVIAQETRNIWLKEEFVFGSQYWRTIHAGNAGAGALN